MNDLIALIANFRPVDALDIVVVSLVVYQLLLLIREARATRIVLGFVFLLLAGAVASRFHLLTLDWLLSNVGPFILIAFVVVFQPDLRRIITQIGKGGIWGEVFQGDALMFKEITSAAKELVKAKRGGLIVIERDDSLQSVFESGTKIEADVSSELLTTLFVPHSPLHDGAAIIRGGKIAAAGCILPLSQNPNLSKHYGTRHRAAVGITEETDALAIVVSEENHTIAFAMAGKITPEIDGETLEEMLTLYGTKVD
ncbi:MAG TPA: diadenylate cyclase CdaA [bacterium]|nr:diadenylate cyclase CdaA [bacterium]